MKENGCLKNEVRCAVMEVISDVTGKKILVPVPHGFPAACLGEQRQVKFGWKVRSSSPPQQRTGLRLMVEQLLAIIWEYNLLVRFLG